MFENGNQEKTAERQIIVRIGIQIFGVGFEFQILKVSINSTKNESYRVEEDAKDSILEVTQTDIERN